MKRSNVIIVILCILRHPIKISKAVYTGIRSSQARAKAPGYQPSNKTMREILEDADRRIDEARAKYRNL